jgi:hypothetical protein
MSASLGKYPSLQLHTVVGIVLWGAIETLALARVRWTQRGNALGPSLAPASPMTGAKEERTRQ